MINNYSDVVILAGGLGTRLKSISPNLPKPMFKVGDKPVLENLIEICKENGFYNITISVGFNYQIICDYFNNGSKFGVNINYSIEDKPLGTTGAIYKSLPLLGNTFIVLYGDTFINVSLNKLYEKHLLINADATLFLHPNDHPHDSDLIEIDNNNFIKKIHGYPHFDNYLRNLVNAGIYVLNKDIFIQNSHLNNTKDIAKYFFPELLKRNYKLYGYISTEYIKDMGTPERYNAVIDDFNKGKPDKLSYNKLQKAIFLDRDGTINIHNGYIKSVDEIIIENNVASAIKNINDNLYLAICVTNQPVIARGELSFEQLDKIHGKIDYHLGLYGAHIDRYYVCPHHPDGGFPGEIEELKYNCDCRKPNTKLIDLAVNEMNISRRESWFIGDSTSDILAGKRSGLQTILLRTGLAGFDGKYNIEPDYVMNNLEDATNWILNEEIKLIQKISEILPVLVKCNLILIGGLARSGKSTLAKTIENEIKKQNLNCHSISMDGWLLDNDERNESTLITKKYSIDKLINLINSKKNEVFEIPIYCRKNKKIKFIKKVLINEEDILIIEGVPALCFKELLNISNYNIYIEIDEQNRYDRFFNDYISRGVNINWIDNLFKLRLKNEFRDVIDSKKFADTIIKLK